MKIFNLMSLRQRQPQRQHLASCGKGDGQAIVFVEDLGPMSSSLNVCRKD